MNHRPFEDWLLDDEPLTIQQQRDLEAHVRSCSTCAAIAESNLALHAARLVAPADGFADRFWVRLEKRRREQRWRQVIGTLVLVVGGALLVYLLAGPFLIQVLQTPATFITAGIRTVAVSAVFQEQLLSGADKVRLIGHGTRRAQGGGSGATGDF